MCMYVVRYAATYLHLRLWVWLGCESHWESVLSGKAESGHHLEQRAWRIHFATRQISLKINDNHPITCIVVYWVFLRSSVSDLFYSCIIVLLYAESPLMERVWSRFHCKIQKWTYEIHYRLRPSYCIKPIFTHQMIITVFSAICSGAHQRKHQIPVSLAFVRWIHRWPVDYPQKGR